MQGRASGDVVLLTGGLGGARLAPALRDALGPDRLTVIANVGDDLDWHGIRVCPDMDSVTYSLAGIWDSERGWGLKDETFSVRDAILKLDAPAWFNVGDRDLAFHLMRGDLLREGHTLSEATKILSEKLGVGGVTILPASDESNETHVLTGDGRRLHFQEWYVGERAKPELREVRLSGGKASPGVISALENAEAVILGPSNPVTSIGAILSLEGMREAILNVPNRIAVSPIVVGVGSDNAGVHHHSLARSRVLSTWNCKDDPASIAKLYAEMTQTFLLDESDVEYSDEIRNLGLEAATAKLLESESLAESLEEMIPR